MRKTPPTLPANNQPAPPAKIATPMKPAVKPNIKPNIKPNAKTKPPVPAPVRVIAETTGAGGRAWKMSGRHAVAYVHDALLASELLATDPKRVAQAAMAVYYDRKGKPFAWQLRFDAQRWDEVVARLL